METFNTKYGKISLYNNERYIIEPFRNGSYWDIDTLTLLKKYVNPDRNLLEIGGHCGTSSIIYASYLNPGKIVYVYEPQKKMYELLVHNIKQNNLTDKIIPFNKGVFCYTGKGAMNNIDLDGGGGNVQKRYNEESDKPCNFGGICLGTEGEEIEMITIDEMGHDNIGFIHCDAQGAEPFVFSAGKKLLSRDKPVIYYENNMKHAPYLHTTVKDAYPMYGTESRFNVEQYCRNILKYNHVIYRFNGGIDDLLMLDVTTPVKGPYTDHTY